MLERPLVCRSRARIRSAQIDAEVAVRVLPPRLQDNRVRGTPRILVALRTSKRSFVLRTQRRGQNALLAEDLMYCFHQFPRRAFKHESARAGCERPLPFGLGFKSSQNDDACF